MKKIIILLSAAVFVLSLSVTALAGDHPKGEHPTAEKAKSVPMQMYHVVLVKPGPNWKSQGTEEGMDIRMQVIDAVRKGAKNGLIVSAGLVNDETEVEFIIIINVETKTEAYKMLQTAPNFKNGMYSADVYSMFAPKGLVLQGK